MPHPSSIVPFFIRPTVRQVRRFFAVIAAVLVGAIGFPAEPAGSQSALDVTRRVQGLRFSLLHPGTGERAAQMRIERVGLEYGRQGIFRVAWKPIVVLEDVKLDIDDVAAWPRVASQVFELMPSLGALEVIVVRRLTLRAPAQSGLTLTAATARFTSGGGLVLTDAVVTADGVPARSLRQLSLPLAAITTALLPAPVASRPPAARADSLRPTANFPPSCETSLLH